jgi:thermostable 8-oxoguanine DNA glycosylase
VPVMRRHEFKWLDEFIALTHKNLLALCVYFGDIKRSEANDIFNQINRTLKYPTQDTFNEQYKKSLKRFEMNGWADYLGL